MFLRDWEYLVLPEQVDAFVAVYGSGGDWAQLFERAEDTPAPSFTATSSCLSASSP
jgi:hypothetical protein